MSVFVLILVLNGSGKAIDHIEFPTMEQCAAAGKAFINIASNGGYTCVPKGSADADR